MDFVELNIYDENGNIARTVRKPITMGLWKKSRQVALAIAEMVNSTEDKVTAGLESYNMTIDFICDVMGINKETELDNVYPGSITAAYNKIINSAHTPL